MKKWPKITLGIACTALLLAELVVRVSHPTPSLEELERTNLFVRYSPQFAKTLRPNQRVYAAATDPGQDPGQVHYRINQLGYRGAEIFLKKRPETVRIVVLGGSHVFDIHGNDPDGGATFTQVLEQQLSVTGLAAEVINAGLPGQDLKNIVLRLPHDIRRLQPDYVLLNSTYNDVKWINYTDTANAGKTLFALGGMPREKLGVNPFTERYNALDEVLGFSKLYLQLRRMYWQRKMHAYMQAYRDAAGPVDYDMGIAHYDKLLQEFVRLVEAMGATPVLCLEERHLAVASEALAQQDSVYMRHMDNSIINGAVIANTYADCDALLTATARQHALPLINHVAAMQARPDWFTDMVHTTPAGSARMGALYAESLAAIIRADTVAAEATRPDSLR